MVTYFQWKQLTRLETRSHDWKLGPLLSVSASTTFQVQWSRSPLVTAVLAVEDRFSFSLISTEFLRYIKHKLHYLKAYISPYLTMTTIFEKYMIPEKYDKNKIFSVLFFEHIYLSNRKLIYGYSCGTFRGKRFHLGPVFVS